MSIEIYRKTKFLRGGDQRERAETGSSSAEVATILKHEERDEEAKDRAKRNRKETAKAVELVTIGQEIKYQGADLVVKKVDKKTGEVHLAYKDDRGDFPHTISVHAEIFNKKKE